MVLEVSSAMPDVPQSATAATAVRLALYQPDRPHNFGAILRLCACLGVTFEVIEPCGFPLDDRRIRAGALDYAPQASWVRHRDFAAFDTARLANRRRLVLLSTAGECRHHDAAYMPDDILMLGSESAGVPAEVHRRADLRVRVPMRPGLRSLNVAMAAAIVLAEALRQTERLRQGRGMSDEKPRARGRPAPGSSSCATGSAPPSRRSRTTMPGAAHADLPPGRFERQPWDRAGRRRRRHLDHARARVREGRRQRLDGLGRVQPRVPPADAGGRGGWPVLGQRHLAGGASALAARAARAHEHAPHPHQQGLVRRRRRPQPDLPGRGRHGGVPCRGCRRPATTTRPTPTTASSAGPTSTSSSRTAARRAASAASSTTIWRAISRATSPSPRPWARPSSTSIRGWCAATWTGPGPRRSASTSWCGAAAMPSST